MIVAVVAERTGPAVRTVLDALAARFAPGRVLAEIRLDAMERPDAEVVRNAPLPVIATCRSRSEGGLFADADAERLSLLERAAAAGASWIDVEAEALGRIRRPVPASVLASIHDFTAMPRDLEERVGAALAAGALRVKVAVRPQGLVDLLTLRRLATEAEGRVVAFGLGAGGIASRLLFRRMGSPWVYARARGPSPCEDLAAPGLPDIEELTTIYFAGAELPEPVAVFGVLSDRAEDSIGPMVFNRIFRRLGIPGIYVPLSTPGLTGLREAIRAFEVRGLSVTTPFKEAVLSQVDDFPDPRVARVSSANTLVVAAGSILAFNTDWEGVVEPVERARARRRGEGRPEIEDALVIGVGGAGRTAAAALAGLGIAVRLTGRRRDRVAAAAAQLGVGTWSLGDPMPGLVVNATPAGGARDSESLPMGAESLAGCHLALEMTYWPVETPFSRAAAAAGAEVIRGAAMYAVQAREQLRRFWARGLPDDAMIEEAVAWALAARASS